MKLSKQLVMGIAGAVSMILAGGSALAHQSGHGGMGHAMKGGMGQGAMVGKGQRADAPGAGCPMGARGGPASDAAQSGMSGHGHGPAAALSQDGREALREKMRNAATPEERQQLALAHRAQMHKRAAGHGADGGHGQGPRMGHGMSRGMGPMHGSRPADTEVQ